MKTTGSEPGLVRDMCEYSPDQLRVTESLYSKKEEAHDIFPENIWFLGTDSSVEVRKVKTQNRPVSALSNLAEFWKKVFWNSVPKQL